MPYKHALDEERQHKRRKVTGPLRHQESLIARSRFSWRTSKGKKSVTALLLLDSGATGPALSQHFVDANQIPVEKKEQRLQVEAENGENIGSGTNHTTSLEVHMGKHMSDIKFEVLNVPR
jgi:hypothetical protein